MQWFSRGDFFPSGENVVMSEDVFRCHKGEVQWTSGGWRPQMLSDISQCTERPPTTNNCPVQNVNRAKAETAGLRNWSQHIHLSLHSYIHLHLVLFLPLPLLQFPLQASTSTMPPWEPEYSENVELFPIKHS